ncbi:GntR family transcriptional regulator [Streptomyces sp. NPDC020917]|uniref:GntR family transcriptional regulator n=1 Tax=Streptomyces sp. NPDC020917 TaxID=3365102 RepID=UPI0037BB8276
MNEEEQEVTGAHRPPYLHIADVLRGEIHDGVFRVGERLPPQAELEQRFNVSRPTVQRALTELRRAGYLDNQRGRAAEVLDWKAASTPPPPPQGMPGPTFQILDRFVAEAFEAEDVTIDAYSLSAETLSSALAAPLNRVIARELNPKSIRLRLLLPTSDAILGIPRLVDGEEEWPLARLRELLGAQVVSLTSAFRRVTDVRAEIVQSVQLSVVPVTPLHKLYILNGRSALSGFYRVVRRDISYREHEGEIFDVLGVGAVLFPYRADPDDTGSHGSRFVEESQEWFDSLWTTIAQPLQPFG